MHLMFISLFSYLSSSSSTSTSSSTSSSSPPPPLLLLHSSSSPTHHKVFDLKGSMRSRYVDPSKDRTGNVLLDENYLNCKEPLLIRIWGRSSEKGPSAYYKNFQEKDFQEGASKSTRAIKMYM